MLLAGTAWEPSGRFLGPNELTAAHPAGGDDPAATASSRDPKAAAMAEASEHVLTPSGERDQIFSLLAYALALRDWQEDHRGPRRGYNIAAVLVDENDVPISWALNAVHEAGDKTQHAEMRAITCYLGTSEHKSLEGYTLYATLESCVMCAGVMYMTSLPRAVYGQRDPDFGSVVERLALDSSSLNDGHPPYPRQVLSEGSSLYHRYWLDTLYEEYLGWNSHPRITAFLRSPRVKEVFVDALEMFETYEVSFPENETALEHALTFHEESLEGSSRCPED